MKEKERMVKQLTVKCTESVLRDLEALAEEKGGQPISFLIREAIAEYIRKHRHGTI